jgi:hypothetical protein
MVPNTMTTTALKNFRMTISHIEIGGNSISATRHRLQPEDVRPGT